MNRNNSTEMLENKITSDLKSTYQHSNIAFQSTNPSYSKFSQPYHLKRDSSIESDEQNKKL